MAKQSVKSFIEKEGLFGLTPQTRCMSCNLTVAQLIREEGKHAVRDGKFLLNGEDDYDEPLREEGYICFPCWEHDLYGHPVVSGRLCLGESQVPFTAGLYMLRTTNEWFEENPWFDYGEASDLVKQYCQKLSWQSVDPWRGYYRSSFDSDWVKMVDDWFGTDGHNIGDNDLGRFHKLYEQEKTVPCVPMLVAFPTGSNVCACGCEVHVRKEDVENFKKWLGVERLEVEE